MILDVSIISKAGILVFNHSFTNSSSESLDIDIQAGLMTAILNVLRETQRETITSIRHREDYVIILYEGVLTYGLLPVTQYDNRLFRFLREVVLKFELMFTEELHKENIINRAVFEPFREIIQSLYTNYIDIDVKSFNEIMAIMQSSRVFNYIIYETKFFHPVFSSIDDSIVGDFKDKITMMSREIVDFGINIKQNFSMGELYFEEMTTTLIKTPFHLIVLFYLDKEKNKQEFVNEIQKIKIKLENLS
ncbi:MAG: hypothetical protein ACFE95_18910 [Candidatus Hodarchaeota archaeon]